MVFSGIPFLYYFLPAVMAVYFLVPRKFKNAVLLFSSLVFYGWGEPKLLWLMVGTILLFYLCGLAIHRAERQSWKKVWLTVSVVLSLSLLGLMNDKDMAVRLLIDEDVLKGEYIGMHPCINTSSLRIRTSDVMETLIPAMGHKPTIVQLPVYTLE